VLLFGGRFTLYSGGFPAERRGRWFLTLQMIIGRGVVANSRLGKELRMGKKLGGRLATDTKTDLTSQGPKSSQDLAMEKGIERKGRKEEKGKKHRFMQLSRLLLVQEWQDRGRKKFSENSSREAFPLGQRSAEGRRAGGKGSRESKILGRRRPKEGTERNLSQSNSRILGRVPASGAPNSGGGSKQKKSSWAKN